MNKQEIIKMIDKFLEGWKTHPVYEGSVFQREIISQLNQIRGMLNE